MEYFPLDWLWENFWTVLEGSFSDGGQLFCDKDNFLAKTRNVHCIWSVLNDLKDCFVNYLDATWHIFQEISSIPVEFGKHLEA